MTRVEIYGQLGAEATKFPDQVTVTLKPADPKTNTLLGGFYTLKPERWLKVCGGFYTLKPERWLKVCQRYLIAENYRIEVEGYFENGESVNLGFHTIYLDMDDDQLREYQARTAGNS